MAKLILPEKTSELDAIQKGWLNFGHLKTTTFSALEKDELAIQQVLLDFGKIEDLEEAQNKLKEAKAIAEESEGRRLYFTNMLRDKVMSPAMEFEKRNAALIKSAESHEFTLRKSASVKEEAANLKKNEENALRAHIENEHFRIAAKYREELSVMILESYKNALQNKTPVKEIKAYKESIKGFLKDVKLDKFVKYDRVHLSKEEGAEIFKSIKPYDPEQDLKKAIGQIEVTFVMYAEDLKNRTKAIKKTEANVEHIHEATEKEVTVQTSMTNLAAQAVEPLVLTGGKTKIKKKWVIVEENSPEWAMEVMMEYIKHAGKARQFVKVSSWSKFSIGQMGAALAKFKGEAPEIKMGKLKFKEEEK